MGQTISLQLFSLQTNIGGGLRTPRVGSDALAGELAETKAAEYRRTPKRGRRSNGSLRACVLECGSALPLLAHPTPYLGDGS
jgi:hypothetical protein